MSENKEALNLDLILEIEELESKIAPDDAGMLPGID
jgi:hypothetical protein